MGVTHVNYKLAECDICETVAQFKPSLGLPEGWGSIGDSCGLTNYRCVCLECLKDISGYIEELRRSHYKKQEGE